MTQPWPQLADATFACLVNGLHHDLAPELRAVTGDPVQMQALARKTADLYRQMRRCLEGSAGTRS